MGYLLDSLLQEIIVVTANQTQICPQ